MKEKEQTSNNLLLHLKSQWEKYLAQKRSHEDYSGMQNQCARNI
jgi:hypothetical protein